jgi:hypothetical protein
MISYMISYSARFQMDVLLLPEMSSHPVTDIPYQNPDENVALSANERFTFEIDSENALVGSTLER